MKAFNSALGATRSCPHCKSTILQSSAVCPACRHFLRFETVKVGAGLKPAPTTAEPLRLEAIVRQPVDGDGCEYSLVVVVTNDRGEELTRQVIDVGSLKPAEARTFTVLVESFSPDVQSDRSLEEAPLEKRLS